MLQHSKIITGLAAKLGSQRLLAEKLGVDKTQLAKWKRLGIPPKHWPRLLKLADRVQFRLTLDMLDRKSRVGNGDTPSNGRD